MVRPGKESREIEKSAIVGLRQHCQAAGFDECYEHGEIPPGVLRRRHRGSGDGDVELSQAETLFGQVAGKVQRRAAQPGPAGEPCLHLGQRGFVRMGENVFAPI